MTMVIDLHLHDVPVDAVDDPLHPSSGRDCPVTSRCHLARLTQDVEGLLQRFQVLHGHHHDAREAVAGDDVARVGRPTASRSALHFVRASAALLVSAFTYVMM